MKKISCLLLALLLTACSSSPQATATTALHPTITATQTPLPTETLEPTIPASDENGGTGDEPAKAAEVASVLTLLDYNQADHESFDPSNSRIGTLTDLSGTDKAIDWLPGDTPVLINTNPNTGEQRVDATFVDVNGDGVGEWVRGLYYPVEGSGGMVIDVMVHPQQELRAYFTEAGGAEAVYGELLTAIAHQKGMSVEQLTSQAAVNDGKVEFNVPWFWNPDNHSRNRSPSYIQASPPQIVDLDKPIVYATRSGGYINQEVAPGVTVPDGIRWVVGQSDAGIAVFVANEQLFVVYESDGNMTSDRHGDIAARIFVALEMIAKMQSGFVDSQGDGRSVLEKNQRYLGASYSDGDTVIDRDVFLTALPDGSDYDFTVFQLE